MHPLETYLRSLSRIRSSGSGVDETSYYGPLETLFNEIGKTLKPKVRCIITLKNRGAGHPDGGLFTADQFQKPSAETPLPGQLPARGALEAKPTKDSVRQIARTKQVKDYLSKYRQLLITNYRDFALTTRGGDGEPIILESYSLAADERAFWEAAAHPRATATTQGKRLEDYLKRVMMHAAPLAAPEDVAWFLASYARDALSRIENADLPALKAVRTSLEESLGLQFEGPKGEHFFRSTLVQTLFYGVFSAWVLWSKEHRPTDQKASFDWKAAAWSLHVPMIRTLFEQIATPSQLGPLGLVEVLDWSAATLNRVDRANFFEKFDEGQAVQYFYEPFLEAFDPALRKQLGVWYTPMEIVQYMVARVDTVLREDLGLEDGLADPNVYVLDPCCGTGTFLVEVLKRIANTLREKGSDALLAQDLKRIARDRVFGFEILPAPFVVAHLQLGLLLRNLGAPLEDYGERISVYLTNALTGWEPPVGSPATPAFPEFVAERDAAAQVKRAEPILVVLGNPPYNSFAGVSPAQELGLVDPYKEGLISEWKIKKFNLDDLYIRFFRLAERRIAEMTGKGIVCYISNFSYLSDPSFVVMRKRFLNEFDKLWFDSMNGDSRETGKLTPDGKPDPSVFSTERNREGIRVGTAVGLMVRGAADRKKYSVRFRNFWGASKRRDLLESLQTANFEACYEHASPRESNRFSFRPQNVSDQYMGWPRLVELSLESPSNGLMEKRGGALIDIDRDVLGSRMKVYYDPDASWNEIGSLHLGLKRNAARFDAVKTRKKVITSESFDSNRLRRYVMRPFDSRWCYYSSVRPLWNEPRPTLWVQCWEGNRFLLSRVKADKTPEGPPFYFVKGLSDDHLLAP
ncbi:MAG: N-6 DNA methylase, partial [Deltaproteobacteria bacterium]|nr:N-6 DNA methylase [Deltaproteobacteria bacterium]